MPPVKPILPVHDERFSVVAEIDGGHAPRCEDGRRQKFCERNLRAPQFPGDGRERITRAGGVHEQAHGDAAFDGAFERGDEFLAARVVVKNVGAERDGFFRGFNRGEHRGKRGVAVDERLYFISRRERLRGDAADNTGDVLEMFRAVGFRLAEIFRNGVAEGFMHAELGSAAADAVDAERKIKNCAENRHKPDDAQPERRGARIALVKQGVNGSEQRGKKIKARSQMRPEPGKFIKPVHRAQFRRKIR